MTPLYLFTGDEFLAKRDADAKVAELVPGASAGLNWVVMDGASPREVAQELATMALFPGAKVVQLRDPEFLLPKKGKGDGLNRAREAWKAGRRKEAARRILAIAGKAGWGPEQLDPSNGSPGIEDWREQLQIELADADVTFLKEVAQFCRDEGVRAPEGDLSPLLQRFEAGLPRGHSLVINASELDAKNSLVALAKKLGGYVEHKVASRLRDLDLNEVAADFLAPFEKRLGRGVEAALKDRIGGNLRLLQSELEKLASYVPGKTIELADVELLVSRSREEEYTELSDALQKRDLKAALRYVEDAMGAGGHALMLLGAIASIVRGLIESWERTAELAPRGAPKSFDEFKARIFPKIEAEVEAKGGRVPHPYAAFIQMQAAGRFRRPELLAALRQCAEGDVLLKSSGSGRLIIERLLWTICANSPKTV